jgi:protein-S-isoprenylcysteine O-methyltransferase Ste14
MLTGLYQTAVILSTALLFYSIDFRYIRHYDKQRKAAGTGRSWDFTLLMFAAVALVAAQPVFMPVLGLQITALTGLFLQLLGVVLLIGSMVLNIWSRRHLKQFYSERVELQPEHRIIESGPYAYVRHPIFTSFFGLVTGLLLVNPSVPTLALTIYTFWDFTRAARQEESLLAQNLPGYLEYTARTKAFIPEIKFKNRI